MMNVSLINCLTFNAATWPHLDILTLFEIIVHTLIAYNLHQDFVVLKRSTNRRPKAYS